MNKIIPLTDVLTGGFDGAIVGADFLGFFFGLSFFLGGSSGLDKRGMIKF